MVKLITYTDDNMTRSADLCRLSSLKYRVDEAHIYGPLDIDDFTYSINDVLRAERGSGYWMWKPYVVLSAMRHMQDGDILIYADAGVEFVAPVQEIIDRMDEDIFFFTNGWPHVEWCKVDCIEAILPHNTVFKGFSDCWKYENAKTIKQVQASVIFFRVNQETRDFVKEWLLWCQMPGFIDDSPSKLPNYPTFAEHRHDQAILTCLAIKHGYTIDHWWPTQYSMHLPRSERDSYPVIFNHHRKRNWEW